MATKSILKNITVKSNRAGVRLANALEKSEKGSKTAPGNLSKRVDIVTDPESIKSMFGK